MTIAIDSTALREAESAENGWLRPGALYGLERLRQMGYRPICRTGDLTDLQIRHLRREGAELFSDIENTPDPALTLRAIEGTDRIEIVDGENSVCEAGRWNDLVERFLFPRRATSLDRKTGETDIFLSVNLDGSGNSSIRTGLNFFDHMLDQIARHGLIDIDLDCRGDLDIDEHHTIEDVAIVLGQALFELCGKDKTGIQRYGFLLPMDEAQAEVAIDLSNRPYLVWDVSFDREYVGDFPLEMAEHFFHTLAMNLKATLQIRAGGNNEHHKIEAIFKGFARALRFAVTRSERNAGLLPSSKGAL